jgi:hypothetical protein
MTEEKEVLDDALEKARKALDYPGLLATEWRGEDWFNFDWIADEIVKQQEVSRGVAERTLRELCATGDVRSIRCDAISEEPEEPEIISLASGLRTKLILRWARRFGSL